MHPVLEKQLKENTLSHALLLVGEGVLEWEVKELVTEAFGVTPGVRKRVQEENHPDFIITKKERNTVTMESLRRARELLRLGPVEANRRFWWIQDAHLLRKEGQNALLKTLEEPPEYLHILLTLPYTNTLLPTVLSRTSTLYLGEMQKNKEEEEALWKVLDTVMEEKELGIFSSYALIQDFSMEEVLKTAGRIFRDFAVYAATEDESLLKYPEKIDMIKKYTIPGKDYSNLALECVRAAEGIGRNVHARMSFEHIFLQLLEETK